VYNLSQLFATNILHMTHTSLDTGDFVGIRINACDLIARLRKTDGQW
jgi:hypothetical protein